MRQTHGIIAALVAALFVFLTLSAFAGSDSGHSYSAVVTVDGDPSSEGTIKKINATAWKEVLPEYTHGVRGGVVAGRLTYKASGPDKSHLVLSTKWSQARVSLNGFTRYIVFEPTVVGKNTYRVKVSTRDHAFTVPPIARAN